ncbi:hypothetical protein FACS189494_08590 [Spirochaetia bacterium]|nr:hypothetical protein FACS189494_08590 [Spirochaetia bacterium]
MKPLTIVFLLLVATANGFIFSDEGIGNSSFIDNPEAAKFFKTGDVSKGIVLLAHGLNVRPSKMGTPYNEGTLVHLFVNNGFDVLRITLSGHGSSIDEMKSVTAGLWLDDAFNAYLSAIDTGSIPIFLCGFSLGALVYEVLMNQENNSEIAADKKTPVVFKKAVLFSPAVAIKKSAHNILMLNTFIKDDSIIDSVSPAQYRAQKGASIAAYKSLFLLEADLIKYRFKQSNIPTLVFIDPNDELISHAGLQKHISEFSLTNWNLIKISNDGASIRPKYHHLLIDSKCVSSAVWKKISWQIIHFFNSNL